MLKDFDKPHLHQPPTTPELKRWQLPFKHKTENNLQLLYPKTSHIQIHHLCLCNSTPWLTSSSLNQWYSSFVIFSPYKLRLKGTYQLPLSPRTTCNSIGKLEICKNFYTNLRIYLHISNLLHKKPNIETAKYAYITLLTTNLFIKNINSLTQIETKIPPGKLT